MISEPIWRERGADGYWFWTPKLVRGQQDADIKDSPCFNQVEAFKRAANKYVVEIRSRIQLKNTEILNLYFLCVLESDINRGRTRMLAFFCVFVLVFLNDLKAPGNNLNSPCLSYFHNGIFRNELPAFPQVCMLWQILAISVETKY